MFGKPYHVFTRQVALTDYSLGMQGVPCAKQVGQSMLQGVLYGVLVVHVYYWTPYPFPSCGFVYWSVETSKCSLALEVYQSVAEPVLNFH